MFVEKTDRNITLGLLYGKDYEHYILVLNKYYELEDGFNSNYELA